MSPILGTDINRTFLAQARRRTVRRLGASRHAARSGELVLFPIRQRLGDPPRFRRRVSFEYHNLVQHPYPSLQDDQASFDLILCRNVMIYFSQEMNRGIIGRFRECLADDGWLVVGHAESNIELFQDFETVNTPDAVLYRKTASLPPMVTVPATTTVPTLARHRLQPLALPHNEVRIEASCDDWHDATDRFREQMTRRPLNPEGHFRYALMLQQRGRLSEAEQSLRRAIYLDRGFVLAHYYLGLLLKRRSELSGARRCFRNALRLLEPIDQRAVFPEAEGIDASTLTELTRMHFEEVKHL